MRHSEKAQKSVAVVKGRCPFCHSQTTLRFFTQQTYSRVFFIRWWSTKYCVTCDSCSETFEISKQEMGKIDKVAERNEVLGINRNFCSNCASQIYEDSKFCGKCGAQLRF